MRLLFVHKHFPGQFLNLARAFAAQPGNEVVFIAIEPGSAVEGIRTVLAQPTRTSTEATHHYVQSFENAVLLGQAAYRAAETLRQEGFIPDLIYAHAGFGPGLYLREAFPDTPIIGHFEWFYHQRNSDADFLSPTDVTPDDALRIWTKNAGLLLELAQCTYGICPTAFQREQFPAEYRDKLQIIHEGVDTEFFSPGMRGQLTIGDLHLGGDVEIVTYATRGMEPYRGFPQFMRSLVHLQKTRPNLHAVIAGDDSVFYGRPHGGGKSWKDALLEELPDLDHSRIHFTGSVSYADYRQLLQASHAHVYLTVPFVLSWSLLEAMSTGCTLIGSDTAPVREIIEDGKTGILVDFFDPSKLAAAIGRVLEDKDQAEALGGTARAQMIDRYDLNAVLPAHFRLASQALGREITWQKTPEAELPVAKSA